MTLYDRVAHRCASAEIPITAAGIREIERYLKEERRVDAYRIAAAMRPAQR